MVSIIQCGEPLLLAASTTYDDPKESDENITDEYFVQKYEFQLSRNFKENEKINTNFNKFPP